MNDTEIIGPHRTEIHSGSTFVQRTSNSCLPLAEWLLVGESVIYLINCLDCKKQYVGETGGELRQWKTQRS